MMISLKIVFSKTIVEREMREKKGLPVDWSDPAMKVIILPADKSTSQQAIKPAAK